MVNKCLNPIVVQLNKCVNPNSEQVDKFFNPITRLINNCLNFSVHQVNKYQIPWPTRQINIRSLAGSHSQHLIRSDAVKNNFLLPENMKKNKYGRSTRFD